MTHKQLADECEQFDTSLYRDASHANAAMTALLQDAAAELRRLAAENEALRKDAERWRTFLATRPPSTHEVINAAIDNAMQKETP